MKKIVFVIADYQDERQEIFDTHLSPRNQKYCDHHGFEYRLLREGKKIRENYTWQKIFQIKEWLDNGDLQDGDLVANVDADMCIVDGRFSIFPEEGKSFALAIDNGNSHCWGWISFRINDWSREMIDKIVCDERWGRVKETKHGQEFREQATWYSLAGIPPHSWVPFTELPDQGWHNTDSEELCYSLDDLYEQVEVRGPEWNTTLLAEEQDDPVSKMLQTYNIVESKYEDTIIRHWAGGQPWNYKKYCKNDIIID